MFVGTAKQRPDFGTGSRKSAHITVVCVGPEMQQQEFCEAFSNWKCCMASFKLRQAQSQGGCFLFETCAQKWGRRVGEWELKEKMMRKKSEIWMN